MNNPLIEIHPPGVSIDVASDLGERLRALSPSLNAAIFMWGTDPRTGGIFASATRTIPDSDRALIEAFANSIQVPIRIEEDPGASPPVPDDDRQADTSPYAGGARYGMGTSSTSDAVIKALCSTGFGYVIDSTEYMLTAGHCFPKDDGIDFMWIVSGPESSLTKVEYAGHVAHSSWKTGVGSVQVGSPTTAFHGDVALVNVSDANQDAGDQIWWGSASTTSRIPVTVRKLPTSGDDICINGEVSGSDCGTNITLTDINYTYPGGEVIKNGDAAHSFSAADCSQKGDSGGSVVVNHPGEETYAEAVGIVSGHSETADGGCNQYFTGVEEAMQAWDGHLHFH